MTGHYNSRAIWKFCFFRRIELFRWSTLTLSLVVKDIPSGMVMAFQFLSRSKSAGEKISIFSSATHSE